MKLISLTMKNFMPYKGETKINFPSSNEANVMVVFGDNMRGKTSFFNAIRWALYGKAIGRHSKLIPNHLVCNREAVNDGDWQYDVCLEFSDNGKLYELRRSAAKKDLISIPKKEEDIEVNCGLKIDGKVWPVDQIIHEINQVAPEPVSRFFLFDGELLNEYEELLIQGSSQGENIKKSIEQILGVPALINARDEIQNVLNEAQKEQAKDLKHVKGLELVSKNQAEQQDILEATSKNHTDLVTDRDRIQQEVDDLEDVLSQSVALLEKKSLLDSLKKDEKKLQKEQDGYREEKLDKLRDAWKLLIAKPLQLKRQSLEMERDNLGESLRGEGAMNVQMEQLRKVLTQNDCPVCEQEISQAKKSEAQALLNQLEIERKNIGNVTEKLSDISNQLLTLNKLRDPGTKDRLIEIESQYLKCEIDGVKIANQINDIKEEIEGNDTSELELKRSRQKRLIAEKAILEQDIKNSKIKIDDTRNKINANSKRMNIEQEAGKTDSSVKVKICSDLEKVFALSIDRLRDNLKKQVQKSATDAFKRLTTEKTYRGLDINNNYGLTIIDQDGEDVPVRSAGAEQIVALSLINGLNTTGRGSGPIIMDTPFGRLDPKHRRNILDYLPEVTTQFILLVHAGELDKDRDLAPIAHKISSLYEIKRISSNQSRIEETSL